VFVARIGFGPIEVIAEFRGLQSDVKVAAR
jgi:hypothetical protein